jgi:hypothetical protein
MLWGCALCLFGLILSACSPDQAQAPAATGGPNAPAMAQGVQWPNLRALDELAEAAEAAAPNGPLPALRELADKIKPSAEKVAVDPPPNGAAKPDQVKVLQNDLKNLADALQPGTMPEAELRANLNSLHPIVEQLMAAAGMPHVHEHPTEAQEASHATPEH